MAKYVEMSANSEISLTGIFGESTETEELKSGDKVIILKDRAPSSYIQDVGDEHVNEEATVTEIVKWNVPILGIVDGVLLDITGNDIVYDRHWLKKV